MLTVVHLVCFACLALYVAFPAVALAFVGTAAPTPRTGVFASPATARRYVHPDGRAGAEGYWRVVLNDIDHCADMPPRDTAPRSKSRVEQLARRAAAPDALSRAVRPPPPPRTRTAPAVAWRAPVRRLPTAQAPVWQRPLYRGPRGRFCLAPTAGLRAGPV